MTISQIRTLLEESEKIGTIHETYWEGGEPFLFYPVMIEGIRLARERGFTAGIVTNCYWSTSVEDARLWLEPISKLGVQDLSVSDDELHFGDSQDSPARRARISAQQLGIPSSSICIAKPDVSQSSEPDQEKGAPVIGGSVKLRGRAVEKFADDLPAQSRTLLDSCPYEDLRDPQRVHIDSYGNVHICQGISIGNCWKTPLSKLVADYNAETHPICGPLIRSGPIGLVDDYALDMESEYVDECHLCYAARLALLDRFPELLAPRQVYGVE